MSKNVQQTAPLSRRSLLRGTGAGLVGLAGLTGISPVSAEKTDEEHVRSLRIAQIKGPVEFDPIVLNDVPGAQIATHVFEGLYVYDSGVGLVPRLATGDPEIENDGQRWIVEIDSEATFQNDAPVTAEDVVYTFRAPVEESTRNAGVVSMIQSGEVVDEQTAQFDIDPSLGSFRHVLARKIVPKTYREDNKKRFNSEEPIGSGPFEFVDWSENEYVKLERYDGYWGDLDPLVETLQFEPIAEQGTRMEAIREYEVDAAEYVPPDTYSTIRDDPRVKISTSYEEGSFYLAYNCNEGPTTDPDVRAGIEHTLSVPEFIDEELGPLGTRLVTPLPRPITEAWEFPRSDFEARINDYDLEAAADLLSGNVPENWSPRIITPPDDKREALAQRIASGLKELSEFGLKLQPTVDRLGWGEFLDTFITGNAEDYTMYALGWSGLPDPDSYLWYLVHASQAGENQGHYYGSEGDAFHQKIQEARTMTERADRKPLYEDVLRELLDETVFTPAFSVDNTMAYRSDLEPPEAHPDGSVHLRTVSEQGQVRGAGLYADENGTVNTATVRAAVDDWQRDEIDSRMLASVLDAW